MKTATGRQMMAGNWKMNGNSAETEKYFKDLIESLSTGNCEVALCVPYPLIPVAREAVNGTDIRIGAQNCHWAESGAFTGEVSAKMLIEEYGIDLVIIGHSERRQYFGETDETVNGRIKAALAAGLEVIFCIGETLQQRKDGVTNDILDVQLAEGLKDITPEQMQKIIVAYEPVWAIGTGETATPQQAQEAIAHIRSVLVQLYDVDIAAGMPILYGGSMNGGNVEDLLNESDINGGLVGGASLKADEFAGMIAAANKL
ncbi:triose-phosphate isomerase [Candidatus Saccharibacteria bacterium]|nr:triose-phosphate isomerase [Candidatus Saccharibacteria bacterium]